MSDSGGSDSEQEIELKKKLQELEEKKVELSDEEILREKLRIEHAKTKYWAPILLLFPLGPVIIAITTVFFGSMILNNASLKCNALLKEFLTGAVILSYVLLLFYSYCWIGPKPIKSLRTLKFFYSFYGFFCFLWWGMFGTLQTSRATSTGLESCLETAPVLYVFCGYQIGIFWIMFSFFMCFALKEIGIMIQERDRILKEKARIANAEKQAIMEEEERKKAEEDEVKAKEEAEQEELRKEQEERERLYASSSDEEQGEHSEEEGDEEDDEGDEEEEEDQDEGHDEAEDEEGEEGEEEDEDDEKASEK